MKRIASSLIAMAMACPMVLAQTPAEAPQTPGANPGGFQPAAKPEEQKFPGPRGTSITFPTGLYDEAADPNKQIAEGIARAKSEHKQVLLMWGENMCGFCVFLNDVLVHDASVKPIRESDYVWVKVDLGKKFTKNRDVAEKWGVRLWDPTPDGKGMGAPVLSVIDGVSGQTVGVMGGNAMTAQPMTMERVFDEKKIQEFLFNHKPKALVAQSVLNDAMAEAKGAKKPVLALVTMPLNEDADAVGAWMSRPEVAGVMSNYFKVVRIDTDRMTGGVDVLKKLSGGKPMLPPFAVMLDDAGAPTGDAMLNSLPKTSEEIGAFVAKFGQMAKVSDAEKSILTKALEAAATPAKK